MLSAVVVQGAGSAIVNRRHRQSAPSSIGAILNVEMNMSSMNLLRLLLLALSQRWP
jgi:hypothetical protein